MSAVQCTVQLLMRHEWSAWDSSASGRGGSQWHERRNQSWGWRVEARSWVGSLEWVLECDSVLWQKIVNFSCYVCPINESVEWNAGTLFQPPCPNITLGSQDDWIVLLLPWTSLPSFADLFLFLSRMKKCIAYC